MDAIQEIVRGLYSTDPLPVLDADDVDSYFKSLENSKNSDNAEKSRKRKFVETQPSSVESVNSGFLQLSPEIVRGLYSPNPLPVLDADDVDSFFQSLKKSKNSEYAENSRKRKFVEIQPSSVETVDSGFHQLSPQSSSVESVDSGLHQTSPYIPPQNLQPTVEYHVSIYPQSSSVDSVGSRFHQMSPCISPTPPPPPQFHQRPPQYQVPNYPYIPPTPCPQFYQQQIQMPNYPYMPPPQPFFQPPDQNQMHNHSVLLELLNAPSILSHLELEVKEIQDTMKRFGAERFDRLQDRFRYDECHRKFLEFWFKKYPNCNLILLAETLNVKLLQISNWKKRRDGKNN